MRTYKMELINQMSDTILALEILDPGKFYDEFGAYGETINDRTILHAIETVRNDERNVVLVYPGDIIDPRILHGRTFHLAGAQDSGTSKHISTMTREIYGSLIGSAIEEDEQ